MNDEKQTRTPRHKTRDLRALQAASTKANAEAKAARDDAAKAKEIYEKKLAETRKKHAKAQRLAEQVKKRALRDAYERAGKIFCADIIENSSDLEFWRKILLENGMTQEMCEMIGLALPAAAEQPGATPPPDAAADTPPPPAAAEPAGATPPPAAAAGAPVLQS